MLRLRFFLLFVFALFVYAIVPFSANKAIAQTALQLVPPSTITTESNNQTPNADANEILQEAVNSEILRANLDATLPSEPEIGNIATLKPEELAPPDLQTTGLIGNETGGIGDKMWLGTDENLALSLLKYLPSKQENPVLSELSRRLLITQATSPAKPTEGTDTISKEILKIRILKLIDLGYGEDAMKLYGLVKANLDQASDDEVLNHLLSVQNYDLICQAIRESQLMVSVSDTPYYIIFCELIAGQINEAALGIQLLREAPNPDQLFIHIANQIVEKSDPQSQATLNLEGVSPSTSLHKALIELGQKGIQNAIIPSTRSLNPTPLLLAAENIAVDKTQEDYASNWALRGLFLESQNNEDMPLEQRTQAWLEEQPAWQADLVLKYGSPQTSAEAIRVYEVLTIAKLNIPTPLIWGILLDNLHQANALQARQALLTMTWQSANANYRAQAVAGILMIARGRAIKDIPSHELATMVRAMDMIGQQDLAKLLLVQALLN